MKIFRVLYTPDNTAYMVYAETEKEAYEKASRRNYRDLVSDSYDALRRDLYDIVEFVPDTNGDGVLTFYDIYDTFQRW